MNNYFILKTPTYFKFCVCNVDGISYDLNITYICELSFTCVDNLCLINPINTKLC